MNPLKERLALLRRQSGAEGPPASAAAGAEPRGATLSLAERLQRLRGAEPPLRPRRARVSDAEVAALLKGECIAEGLILVEERYPLSFRHGSSPLSQLHGAPLAVLCEDGSAPAPEELIFMDTETSGLAGGTGTLAFLLGLGRIAGDALVVRQFFLTGFGGERALLQAAREWLPEGGWLVSFNGKCFDAPLLAARYRLTALEDPFAALPHIDLLYPTRRAFGRSWTDCRLQTAERRLLAFARSGDIPGWEVPECWFEFVRAGVTERLPAILEHNRWDLVSLAALLPLLAHLHAMPDQTDADVLAIARSRLRQGDEAAAFGQLRRQAHRLDEVGLLELARLHRRRGEWSEAVALWERLAARGSVAALEYLAKYHEHVRRDYVQALACTRRLIARDGGDPRHRHRERRLLTRLGGREELFRDV